MRLLAVGVCEADGKLLAIEEFGMLSLPKIEVSSGNPRDELRTFFLRSFGIEVEIGRLFGEKYIESGNELLLYYLVPLLPQIKEAKGVIWVKLTKDNLKELDPAKTGELLTRNSAKEVLKLLDIMERTISKCPWGAKQTPEDILKGLTSEMEEFKVELSSRNRLRASFEAGDIIYDAFLLSWIFARDNDMAPETILKRVNNKIAKRKPWLFSERGISFDEAKKLWEYYKSLED